MKRVLLLATTTGYQTRMFAEAAATLGVELIYATDRCDQLDDPWRDGAIAVRFHEEERSVDTIVAALKDRPIDGVLAVGDRPTVLAALVSQAFGLPGNAPEAARAARDKRLAREKFRSAGLLVPEFITVPASSDPESLISQLSFPVVVKPTVLSGSRGVIRADDPAAFRSAFKRLQRLLDSDDVRELRDADTDLIQIERYIPGREYALEGWLEPGGLRLFALFDKPDPLDGPFFEETIYVTPLSDPRVAAPIIRAVGQAAAALGLRHGPIHAECRLNERGVFVLEVAARPIGGLCSKALRFVNATTGETCGLEQRLLQRVIPEINRLRLRPELQSVGVAKAIARDMPDSWDRQRLASAVMMIPIPKAGIYRRVRGVERARAVPGVEDVIITAKPDQRLVPLPEGASYLGFIFVRAHAPAEAERTVRLAHEQLRFEIDPVIEVLREPASP